MPTFAARIGLGRLALVAAAALAALLAVAFLAAGKSAHGRGHAASVVSLAGGSSPTPPAGATASAGTTDSEASQSFVQSRSAVQHASAVAPGAIAASATKGIAPGAPSDAEVKRELKQLSGGVGTVAGALARLLSNGQAEAPFSAPSSVQRVIAGGNAIADFPYIWGGGHGSFTDKGYDCSGSVSYALAAGGLLGSPLTSGSFESWGDPGPGKWITVEASAGHVYMYVAGLRFDTSGRSGPLGSRWQAAVRPNGGFVARHPPGL